ncbi:MAG: hypothetical protein HC767_14410 [Akkermansiaceae bacterium]|nr:hypothetical protein [Akkermansiaceae bacterium]
MNICNCSKRHSRTSRQIRKPEKAACTAAQGRSNGSFKKFLFVCGGTGGHVFPAVAVAQQVIEQQTNGDKIDIKFMGFDDRDREPVRRVECSSWIRGAAVKMSRPYLSASNIVNIFRLLAAIMISILFMLREKPDIVLGKHLLADTWSASIVAIHLITR